MSQSKTQIREVSFSALCFKLLTQAWLQASACWCSPSQVLSLETETLHTGPAATPSAHSQAETQQEIRVTHRGLDGLSDLYDISIYILLTI